MANKLQPLYTSEHTRFMREWLEQHPEQREVKLSGRRLWSDKPSKSMDEMQRLQEARVEQKPYVYYTWDKR